jgi:ribonucleoside-triphosphate reductase
MPRLAYMAEDETDFINRLEKMMIMAKESLEIKRKVLEQYTEMNLYPYTKFYLRGVKERSGNFWKNHFSTIGLIGMNEACRNLLGVDLGTPEGKTFTEETMDFMRMKLVEFQDETENFYNLEATPAEGTTYRLAKLDKRRYSDIIVADEEEYKEGAEPFYTNSTHLPVFYSDDLFEVLDQQDSIQTKYTGGTVLHLFTGEKIHDAEMVKVLVKRICENYKLPYFTFSPTFSVCPVHGYLVGEQYKCPECGEQTEVYSRVVGYLRPVQQWNKGKKVEFKLRKTFKVAT